MEIREARPEEYSTVLGLLFGPLDEDAMKIQLTDSLNRLRSVEAQRQLLVFADDGRVQGAIWLSPMPGRTALLVGPKTLNDDRAAELQLIESVVERASLGNTGFVQAVIYGEETELAEQLDSCGFSLAAKLKYLTCLSHAFPKEPPTLSFELTPATEFGDRRLKEVVRQTYADSLDCPLLDGMREMDDVIDGYRQTGTHRPQWWLIAHQGEDLIGCLLVTDHEGQSHCELVYMGVIPEHRGKGFGGQLTEYALFLANQAAKGVMVLGVDANNTPAIAAYQQLGFGHFDERMVWVRAV